MTTRSKHTFLFIVLFGILWVKAASLLSMPYLALYLSKHTNLSITTIGVVVGCQPFALCFGSMIGGYLSDIFRRQTILLCSVLLGSLVYLGFYLASEWLLGGMLVVVFASLNLINGFCSALFSPVARATLSDIAETPEENVKYLHARYLALNLGAAIGPLLGAYVGIVANNSAFLVTGISYILYASLFLLACKQEGILYEQGTTKHERYSFLSSLHILIKNKAFLYLLLSLTVFNILYVQLTSNLGLIISQNITNGVVFFSWMLSLNAILVVVLQPALFIFIKNIDQQQVILFGYIVISTVTLLMVLFPISKLMVIVFVACMTLAEVMVFPTSSVLVGNFVEEKYRGMAYGVIDLEYFGSAIGPAIGGFILQQSSLNWYWGCLSIFSLVSVMIYKKSLEG